MIAVQLANLGLYTFTNLVGQAPPGAMVVAENINIDKPGVAETRRGFMQYGTLLSGINKMFAFQNRLLVNHGTSIAYDSDGAGTWTDYGGTFNPPTGDKIRGTEANSNFYFTTNNGIYKIDLLTNNPYPAGGVPALDVVVSLAGAGSGFLANTSQCAYRITWVYVDANNNEIEGNPSESVTLSNNSGNSDNGVVTFTIPATVTTAYFYRIYRTLQTGSLSIPPSDTFQLAYQAQPDSTDITNKYVTVTDITPDSLLGQLLYTSPGAEGEFQTNDIPPLANDICTFQGMTFYLNCQTAQQSYVTIISVGSPNGIQVNDTISIFISPNTYTYTAKNSNNFASRQFAISTGGTIAQNIDATARNLVSAINQDPGSQSVYAYYVSGFNQLPGQILLKTRQLQTGLFSVTSSRGGAYSPVIPASGQTYASSNDTVLNGLYVSKLNQPEAVPSVNLLFIGSSDQPGYRVYPLRDAVIVQSKGGVFRVTGTAPDNLTVSPFDNTVIQYGNDTGVTLNNSVYSFTTQGEISVTESGSQIMSRNVEGDLLTLAAPNVYTNFPSLSFGISYESDRKYILCAAANPSDTVSTVQYVYNWITQSFTTWNLSVTCGIVNPFDNLLYWGGSDGQVLRERKNYNITDYADRQWNATITGATGKVVTLADVSNAVIGYSLAQNISNGQVGLLSVITNIDPILKTVTLELSLPWSNGSAIIAQPIQQTLTYTPLTCGYPNFVKRFQPVLSFVFGQSGFTQATIGFSTDFYQGVEQVTLLPKLSGGWGTFPFGTVPFGLSAAYLQGIPTFLTKNTFMAHWLNISVTMGRAFENMELSGIYAFYDIFGERSR